MFLKLNNIKKEFSKENGVTDINLQINKGELVTLLGPSGCGKTTTLNIIGGFLKPDNGTIILEDADITLLPPEKRPIATVFQSYALFPHMNVIENISYGLKYTTNFRKKERLNAAKEYINIVGLKGYEYEHVGDLSGGQQQRVALARALITKPKLLLLDEPFSNLDAKLRIKMREEIKQIQNMFNITMIFVTHDQEEALSISDRIVVMDRGEIIQVGTPREIYRNPTNEYVASFIGKSNIIEINGSKKLIRPEDIELNKDINGEWEIKNEIFIGSYTRYIIGKNNERILVDLSGIEKSEYKLKDKVNIRFKNIIDL
ncbi:ABC transporter ATP-binding protein [Paraclostridium sp. AKS73]|uniref:ABC transporter ATP-binding protein n=1 Tax=Paraclostridium sp. AKS73 TaxID=2876116 RepID=UPI0021E0769D|nr:ABC transporter ATP-binding protein [Paraclostridium sp. AKS73]MCU9814718.1 ABC transporter ATP-binding protein [Paraclostridium sp. AKS73]